MIRPLGIRGKIGFQKIGEEKDFKDSEHDEQLDENDLPQCPSDDHGTKPVDVQVKNSFEHFYTAFFSLFELANYYKFGYTYTLV